MVLICLSSRVSSCAVFQSLALPCRLFSSMSSIRFPPPVCILFRPLNLALRLASAGLYALCLCPDLHSPSLPHAIFLHLEIVPILPLFHFSPFGQSLRDSFFILSFIFFRPLNLAPPPSPSPSPRGYTSVLQMFCPSQI